VHAYGGVSKFDKTPLFVTVGSSGVKAKSKGIYGEVYVTLLQEHVIPACEALMAQAHACKKVGNRPNAAFKICNGLPKAMTVVGLHTCGWGIVSSRLHKRSDLSPRDFDAAIQHEWETITYSAHCAVFNSIPKRLRESIANDEETNHR
jgi:hypothetical protein